MAGFHHIELWITDLDQDLTEWAWLLEQIGFDLESSWPQGQSWSAGNGYLTLTTSPNTEGISHNRRQPGVNHIAFDAGTRALVDAVMDGAASHGWRQLYADRYPFAGGPDHYAGWLENSAGFKVELVATAE